MTNKANQAYWNHEYTDFNLHIANPRDVIRQWLETHFAPLRDDNRSCIEIGCYPGRFLAVFGELGYRLSGIDLAANLAALPAWLATQGYQVADFWHEDFTEFRPQRKFDVVASFGFVEHFTNWQEILLKHAELVADRGYLVVEAPNFTGDFQRWLHSNYDKANYARHHVPAMNVEAWRKILEDNGFDIIFAGYFGRFHFWTEPDVRSFQQRCALRGLRTLKPLLKLILPRDRKSWSPFCGVIARKR